MNSPQTYFTIRRWLVGAVGMTLLVGNALPMLAQDDDDSVFVPPSWANVAVQKAADGDLDGALKVLDKLERNHANSYALPLLRAKVWGEKYGDATGEEEEVAVLKQERRYLLQAKALATGPQNKAVAAEIASDLQNAERLLRDAGVNLSTTPSAPRPQAKPAPAAKRPVVARPVAPRPIVRPAATRPTAPAKVVKLPSLKPRRGYVIGRAVYPDGRPVSEFDITVVGYDGQINIFPGSLPQLGKGKGKNGRYAIRTMDTLQQKKPVAGLVVGVQARTKISYRGKIFNMDLWPTDDLRNGTSKGDFRGNSGPGVVRDFMLKISGSNPQYRMYDQSETGVEGSNSIHFYGGTLNLDLGWAEGNTGTTLKDSAPSNSTLVVTLVPQGTLMDGSTGQTIKRSIRFGKYVNYYNYLYNIPIGAYSVTADLITPDGSVWNLRGSKNRENYTRSVSFVNEPSTVLAGAETVQIYLVR